MANSQLSLKLSQRVNKKHRRFYQASKRSLEYEHGGDAYVQLKYSHRVDVSSAVQVNFEQQIAARVIELNDEEAMVFYT